MPPTVQAHDLHHRFLGILHHIVTHVRIAFRDICWPHQKHRVSAGHVSQIFEEARDTWRALNDEMVSAN